MRKRYCFVGSLITALQLPILMKEHSVQKEEHSLSETRKQFDIIIIGSIVNSI